jgi:hypothetical protein
MCANVYLGDYLLLLCWNLKFGLLKKKIRKKKKSGSSSSLATCLIQNFICKFVFDVISSIHVRFWKFQSLTSLEKWKELKYAKKKLKQKVLRKTSDYWQKHLKKKERSHFTHKKKNKSRIGSFETSIIVPVISAFFFSHLVSTFLSCFIDSLVCLHLLIFFLFVF